MILRNWNNLPSQMKNEPMKAYYDYLKKKQISLLFKFAFDRCLAAILLILLAPLFLYIAYKISKDSPGGIFFRQLRITQYGREFKIYKFRTMIANAESLGSQVTVDNDKRITAIGEKLRKTRLDELPQLINVLKGEMSFVGTRPEVPKYIAAYTAEMMATLLLPAGITSEASIEYKDEDKLLSNAKDPDKEYIEKVLPEKMKWNLESIRKYSFSRDLLTMIKTVLAVIK
ncbi:sugar transferase [Avibacterium sp. 20-15]|uniref:sugar transferase n=1 Tax=unclassified Avibacterium TaxID=2685287 RepID=UPI0020267098|nr:MULTISPECIES: sugar transferase [unclassified Avibacterium]MCW9732197.1 sugar transferase [Avibacterium sp. 20-15]URL03057.1 sugar transferase [Avibacterium sp. 20-126]URL05548.1 sugar transferase [Avibacterium sp. 20-132]